MQTTVEDISKLKTGSVPEKKAIINALARSKNPAACQLLIESLADSDWAVRKHAAEKIATYGPSVVQPLGKALATGTEDQKFWAVRALVLVGNQSVPLLVKALVRGTKSMRIYAAGALGELGDANTVPYLIKALCDSVWRVRRSSFEALVNFGEKAIPGRERGRGSSASALRAPPPGQYQF